MPAETSTAIPPAPFKPSGDPRRKFAIACQGGGSHTAFTAGLLVGLLADEVFWSHHRLVGLSGTSGGAVCASLTWSGLHSGTIQPGANQQPVFASDSKAAREEAARRVFEPVRIEQVELDDAVAEFGGGRDIDLDLASKFSIAPGFIRDLMDVGLEQARRTSAKLMTEKQEEVGIA
jgi:hypothetical protein